MHLYRRDCLQILATQFGRFLGTNNATLNKMRAKAIGARLCIEVNLKEEPIKGFPIVVSANRTIWQEVGYEKPGEKENTSENEGETESVVDGVNAENLMQRDKLVQDELPVIEHTLVLVADGIAKNHGKDMPMIQHPEIEPVTRKDLVSMQGKEGQRSEVQFDVGSPTMVAVREDQHVSLSDLEDEDVPSALARQKHYNSDPESNQPSCKMDSKKHTMRQSQRDDKMIRLAYLMGLPNFCSNAAFDGKIWIFWSDDCGWECNSIECRDLWQSLELVDSNESPWLVVMGQRLSWCNGHEGHTHSWARLDRAIINIHFAIRFPSAFFEYLNQKTSDHCPMLIHFQKQEVDLSSLILNFISEENNVALALTPTEAEILAALKSIPRESSPKLNGFGSGFYLSCWDLIKEDLIDAAKDFFSGFVEGKFSITYLGVPLVSGRLTSRHLEPLIEKIRRKIAGWKLKLLSQGGRLTLMKHVLACMSTHLLAVLNVPMKVFSRLNSLLSTFFLGDLNGKPRMKWCAWDRICKPYKEGGLGIQNFHEVQMSLHMKFAWRLVTVDNLWTRFFRAKYVKHGHIFFPETRRNASHF
ncbi:hypothetical protein Patl1_15066 [Pistacia atlantica]|uniref:Uncharacterized protein n=1 Tax=Pistacia atlantica TaxID=434234 RepID=A0ACC1B9A0_9ROSI|nr:hypothetical protein Patl1_15066 [Pistacia atlantica]